MSAKLCPPLRLHGPLQISRCMALALPAGTRWQRMWKGIKESFRLMVGVRDYQYYLSHMRQNHPQTTPMTEKEFHRYCLNARFPSEPGKVGKCPC
ncbi:YbdD/YjiX family protein [Candidatus Pantoea multigeneris]|uniref:YbdD/YjiX family protein n=1 Tax=Candidatus Pantoea multigeneris TaxID=2608357 RepID=A0ABX0RA49_9GAMM|nr:YbdD/YjiX family protein [Pantoea multigeneris]